MGEVDKNVRSLYISILRDGFEVDNVKESSPGVYEIRLIKYVGDANETPIGLYEINGGSQIGSLGSYSIGYSIFLRPKEKES